VLFYACFIYNVNEVGAPSRENIADKSEAKSKQARLASDSWLFGFSSAGPTLMKRSAISIVGH
jgi:hypothetical protein